MARARSFADRTRPVSLAPDVSTPDEDGLISVWATMHLHDGRRIQLPGLDHLLAGGGPYTRRRIAKISEHVATLNRMRDNDALSCSVERPQ
jgi:hypothetical protein